MCFPFEKCVYDAGNSTLVYVDSTLLSYPCHQLYVHIKISQSLRNYSDAPQSYTYAVTGTNIKSAAKSVKHEHMKRNLLK